MKELVELLAKNLVNTPDEVVATEEVNGKHVQVTLNVAPSDMGKVIGKQGKIAKAMRLVVKAAATKNKKSVDVDIK